MGSVEITSVADDLAAVVYPWECRAILSHFSVRPVPSSLLAGGLACRCLGSVVSNALVNCRRPG